MMESKMLCATIAFHMLEAQYTQVDISARPGRRRSLSKGVEDAVFATIVPK